MCPDSSKTPQLKPLQPLLLYYVLFTSKEDVALGYVTSFKIRLIRKNASSINCMTNKSLTHGVLKYILICLFRNTGIIEIIHL